MYNCDRRQADKNANWIFPWRLTPLRFADIPKDFSEYIEDELERETSGLYRGVAASWALLKANPKRNYVCRAAFPCELELIKKRHPLSKRAIVVVARISRGNTVFVADGKGGRDVEGPCFFQIATSCHYATHDRLIHSWGEQACEALFGMLLNQGDTAPEASAYFGIIRVTPSQRFEIEW